MKKKNYPTLKKYNWPHGGGSININLSLSDPKLGEDLIEWQVKSERSRSDFVRQCLYRMFVLYEKFPETLTLTREAFNDWVDEHID